MSANKVIAASDWMYQGDDAEFLRFAADVMRASAEGACVQCFAQQPDDTRWPAYQLEIETLGDIDYRACPACEGAVDAKLAAWGMARIDGEARS